VSTGCGVGEEQDGLAMSLPPLSEKIQFPVNFGTKENIEIHNHFAGMANMVLYDGIRTTDDVTHREVLSYAAARALADNPFFYRQRP
jgi:hypothetical protein